MKRYIRSSSPVHIAQQIAKAQRQLDKYDSSKVEYVEECRDAIASAISDSYSREDDDKSVGPTLSEIKRDYLLGAIEDDFMTEEEFDEIFELLDVIDLDYASRFA